MADPFAEPKGNHPVSVCVTRPHLAFPPHKITTDAIRADIAAHHPDHPKLGAVQRLVGRLGVGTRHMMRPLDDPTVAGEARITQRNSAAFEDAAAQAIRAVSQLLRDHDLGPEDIDAVVTSHTTSWTCPGLDVHLSNVLGLRPEIARTSLTTMGCAGGMHALVKAVERVAAHPDDTVLVVVAETLSTVYNHVDTSVESMIYKGLFGDCAAAVLVSGRPRGTGPQLTIDHTWEYVLPHSADRYRGRLDEAGLHFDSTPAATAAVSETMPALNAWLSRVQPETPPQWAAVHAGGPRILSVAAEGLGFADSDLRHSWESLDERGNLGGASVLDVIARTYDDPPADGTSGVLLGFGPGFVAASAACSFRTNA